MGMSFEDLRSANERRTERHFHKISEWSPTDWACAFAGETGEACNIVKKMRRGESALLNDLGDEIADAVIYADLLANRVGLSLEDCIRWKFNKTSSKIGSSIRL